MPLSPTTHPFFKRRIQFSWLCLAGLLATNAFAQDFSVSLNIPSPTLDQAKWQIETDLAPIDPKTTKTPTPLETPDLRALLVGDLFGTGDTYALVELPTGAAFAEFSRGHWHLRGLWNIATDWQWDQGGKAADLGHATEVFYLKDLSGDGIPEVITHGKEGNVPIHNLFRFDPKTRQLQFLAYSRTFPELSGKYVLLYYNGEGRRDNGSTIFCRWEGTRLVTKVTWKDDLDLDKPYLKAILYPAKGEPETFLLKEATSHDSQTFIVTRNDQPYATFVFHYTKRSSKDLTMPWLFEHVTGQPRRLYPNWNPDRYDTVSQLEDYATITIKGSPEARKRFKL